MRVLRIKLRQNQAAYNREESYDNKMTYPLPPFSTVIGALHNACGYEEYHPMDISIQGKYGSMQREIYVNHGLLNNRHDDRNILVYFNNPNLMSAGFTQVGEGLKGQGNSFINRKTVRIDNESLYKRYIELEALKNDLNDERINSIRPSITKIKDHIKELKEKLKEVDKKSEEGKDIQEKVKELTSEHKEIDSEFKSRFLNQYEIPSSHYRTLVKAPKYQEVLYDVELVIHVSSDDKTIDDIKANINNLNCLGRSEDFVELIECKKVKLSKPIETVRLKDNYKIFVNIENITEDEYESPFFFDDGENKKEANGTIYYVNKEYSIIENKRIFNKIPCLYSSFLAVDEESDKVLVDEDGYITDFN